MKRVLIFTSAYFPHVGGAEVAIKEITDRITPDEYAFTLICAKYSRLQSKEQIGNVTVYRVGFGVRVIDKFISPFWSAILALSLPRHDAYWAVMVTYGSVGAYIANLFRLFSQIPVVLTLQEGDPPHYIRTKWFGLLGLSWRLALSQSAAVSVISSYLERLAREFGYTKQPVLIPNGVSVAQFGEIKKKPHEGIVLVTTSRLVKKNAIDDVIRALTLLQEEVSFVVYGVGPDMEMLRKLANELGVEKRVLFMGQLPYEKLPEALSACDIFVRPSRSEGMGNSFIEAMAAGLPVIGTQEGGIADFLFDAKRNPEKETTGWAVDKDTPEQIADAVRDIRSDKEKTKQVTEAARRMVIKNYDWDLIAQHMKELFDRIIEKR